MKTKKYTYMEVVQEFKRQVKLAEQDAQRIPARDSSPKGTLEFAETLYNEKFADALHPSVLEEYEKAAAFKG